MFRRFTATSIITGTQCMKVLSSSLKSSVSVKRCLSSSKTLFSATDKDLPSPLDLTPVDKLYGHDTDILLEQIHKARSVDRVIELVGMHIDVMNDNHVCSAFSQIHDNLREKTPLSSPDEELTSNEAFQALCNRAMKRARFLDSKGVINVFKTLTKLHVPCNTYVMQAMLKMLCSQINQMSLNELTFLSFLLQKQDKNSLVESLKLAIPLVLQIQIDQQLDSENLNEAVSCLKLACRAKLKPATIEKIVQIIKTRVSDFTADHAISVIYSLLITDLPVAGYLSLLMSSFDIISEKINELPRNVILDFVKMCRKQSFYYRSFFLNLSKRVVREKWELHDCYDIVCHLSKLEFFSPEILELLTQRILANAETVKNHSKYSVLTLTEFYSIVDYPFHNLHSVLDILAAAEDKLNVFHNSYPHLFVKLVTSWCMMEYFDNNLLRQILNERYLFSAWSISKRSGRAWEFEHYICLLKWSLEMYERDKQYTLPSNFYKEIISSIQARHLKSPEYPLTAFLENGLGGKQFFLNGVITRDGHFIDHVVAMRTGNYPVSLSHIASDFVNNQRTYFLEDLQLSEDVRIIPILVGKKQDFFEDPELVKTHLVVSMRHLLKLAYHPVIVNYEKWYSLPEREKIPYLMHEIKQAIQTDNVSDSTLCPAR